MHIIFVTLTRRYWGEELKGRLKHRDIKRWFLLLLLLFCQLHLSHSLRIHNSSAFNNDMKYWQTAALSLVLSLMLSTVCIHSIVLSSSFEWFRVSPPITTLIRKEGKQARLNSYNGERERERMRPFTILSSLSCYHFSHNCNKSSPPPSCLSRPDLWSRT